MGSPRAFFLTARFISPNTTDAGCAIFAAMVAFAFSVTESVLSSDRADGAGSIFAVPFFGLFVMGWVFWPPSADGALCVIAEVVFFVFFTEFVLSLSRAEGTACFFRRADFLTRLDLI